MIGSLRFALLPLALGLGCNGLTGGEDQACEGEYCSESGNDCTDPLFEDSEECEGVGPFVTAARMIAPYGWMGDFYATPIDDRTEDPVCEGVGECVYQPEDPDTYELELEGDLFLCVSQETPLSESDSAATTDFTWEGAGQCGLAPEGEADGGWAVRTDIGDRAGFDQVWIQIVSYAAIVTQDTFFYEDTDYLLEGWISEDLTQVYFHRVLSTGEAEMTLTLQ